MAVLELTKELTKVNGTMLNAQEKITAESTAGSPLDTRLPTREAVYGLSAESA